MQDVDGERFGAIVDGGLGGHTDERGEVFHEAVGDAVDLFLVLQEAAGPVMVQVQPSVEGGRGADPFVWPGDLSGPAPVSAACRLPSSPHAFAYALPSIGDTPHAAPCIERGYECDFSLVPSGCQDC
ncbi:hypothetical protein [Streptomyces sp. NBRC 109706]|uniref:hypothetical protein n=1 Tax=Streptomyces sp. NBRC 109706 TaxID=1550035 RepID=UPI00131E2B89|nr:hypothetical protein [Streptomyces sp. NBRC 109706]